MFRVFTRPAWRKNPSWPNGYEPYAVSMDECRTIETFETSREAIDYCTERNDRRPHKYESNFYEWTEI